MTHIVRQPISSLLFIAAVITGFSLPVFIAGPADAGTVIGKKTYNWSRGQFISNCSALRADVLCDARKGLCTCDDGTFVWVWPDPAVNPPPHHVIRRPSPTASGGEGGGISGGGRGGKP